MTALSDYQFLNHQRRTVERPDLLVPDEELLWLLRIPPTMSSSIVSALSEFRYFSWVESRRQA